MKLILALDFSKEFDATVVVLNLLCHFLASLSNSLILVPERAVGAEVIICNLSISKIEHIGA